MDIKEMEYASPDCAMLGIQAAQVVCSSMDAGISGQDSHDYPEDEFGGGWT